MQVSSGLQMNLEPKDIQNISMPLMLRVGPLCSLHLPSSPGMLCVLSTLYP